MALDWTLLTAGMYSVECVPHDSQHTTEVRTARASATTRHWPQTPPHISVTGMVSIRDTRGPPDAEIINTPYSLYPLQEQILHSK